MKHPINCKFCKKPIIVEVDDGYMELGDPLKLLPLASCNRCADLRVRRRSIEDAVFRTVLPLFREGSKPDQADIDKARTELVPLTKKYTRLVADWVGSVIPAWDEEIVNFILDRPDKWTMALKQCWKMYEDAKVLP